MKNVFSAKIWFVKISTRIVKFESRVVKSLNNNNNVNNENNNNNKNKNNNSPQDQEILG